MMYERRDEEHASMQFQGSFVYCEYSNSTYMVDGIEWNKKVTDTFTRTDARGGESQVTFEEYFFERYGYKIKDKTCGVSSSYSDFQTTYANSHSKANEEQDLPDSRTLQAYWHVSY